MGKITNFLREYVLPFSIILTVLGLLMTVFGALGIWMRSLFFETPLEVFYVLDLWNAYLFVGGLIVLAFGAYYLYSYTTKRRFLLRELKTNKRSEILAKHGELRRTARHLPTKFQTMLQEKEDEFNIR